MRVKFSEIPDGKKIDDYPEGTVFVLNDRPRKYDESTGKFVKPGEPRYGDIVSYEPIKEDDIPQHK